MSDSTHPGIQIKGIREGLLVNLREGEWADLLASLLAHLDQQREFLKGARLALDVGNQTLKAADLGHLRDQVSERGLVLWAVIGDSPRTVQSAQALGLATQLSKPRPERVTRALETNLQGEQATLVRRTLRSGFKLESAGHVIVIGDVNPGAEIVAGGDIIVWGRLSGMVHAGAEGNEEALVCALDLSPTQLRIAGQIAITPTRRGKPAPEMAVLKDGEIHVEGWATKGKA